MNLPPLIKTALQQLQHHHVDQAQAATRVAKLHAGEVLLAAVNDSQPLTAAERALAIRQLQARITNATRQASTPEALQQLLRNRAQLTDWMQAPRLNLVELQAGNRQVHTITPLPLVNGQRVEVAVRADSQLQLLGIARAATVNAADPPLRLPEARAGYDPTGRPVTGDRTPTPQALMLADALRSSLPRQRPVTEVLQLVTRLHDALAALPRETRSAVIPPPVEGALKTLARLAPAVQTLQSPDGLRRALNQSGLTLENTLARQTTGRETHLSPKPLGPTSGADRSAPAPGGAPTAGDSERTPLVQADLKAALLSALQTLNSALPRDTPPLRSSSDTLLFSLLGLLQKTPPREQQFGDARKQFLQGVQQQISAALAKIQTQQLQTLNQRLGETGPAAQGGYFELPVRLADGYSTFLLHIQERWLPREEENDAPQSARADRTRIRQWEVFMEFDLNELGKLAAQINLVEQTISARLWAEVNDTWHRARDQLAGLRAQLETSGIAVKDIQCLEGRPPSRSVNLSYSLADVTT